MNVACEASLGLHQSCGGVDDRRLDTETDLAINMHVCHHR